MSFKDFLLKLELGKNVDKWTFVLDGFWFYYIFIQVVVGLVF